MILAIDIGNTNIVLGCVDDNKTYFIERLSTIKTKMELEYAIDIKMVLDIHGIKPEKLEGAIISSVVPQITYVVKEAAEKILKKETLVIGPGVKNGLNILMDNPAQLGSDLVANAVAGIAEYKAPMMIFDLGTATTVASRYSFPAPIPFNTPLSSVSPFASLSLNSFVFSFNSSSESFCISGSSASI